MEELSIEQKAKLYDERLKSATIAYKDEDRHLKATLERIFPELKEEVDELTWLTNYISEEAYCLSMDIRDNEDRIKLINLQRSLAWLEEQGQTFTKKDVDDAYLKGVCDTKHELEKQGEQKIVWSEDDEEMLNQVIEDVVKLAGPHVCYYKDINWLKSLKDRAQSNQGEMSKMCPTSVQDKL